MTSDRQQPPPTRNGLLPEATHLVLPKGIVTSAYPATERVCQRIGIIFDPWEADLNRCLLARTRDGLYAADTVLLSIPRQVGKTFDLGSVVFADSIINPGTTSVWTAHRFKVSRETFTEMQGWAKSPLLKPHIDYDDITTSSGNEVIPFRNGSRIVFAARERGAIRGFTKVRRLVLDEAQILTDQAMADLVPTMNQAVNPQIVLMCTPPKPTDPSEIVTRLRREALAGESEGLLYVELSADPDCDSSDRAAWRKANPSYPARTPARAILRMKKLLTPEDFRREALGIWDIDDDDWHANFMKVWAGRRIDVPSKPKRNPLAFVVDASPQQETAAIAVASWTDRGVLVEIPEGDYRPGVGWVLDRVVALHRRYRPRAGIIIDPRGPASGLIADIEAKGIEVIKPTLVESAAAFASFTAGVFHTADLWHLGQPELADALKGAVTRDTGDGGKLWARKDTTVDICPLVAVTLAQHYLRKKGRGYDLRKSFA